jgi:hypothetical protein
MAGGQGMGSDFWWACARRAAFVLTLACPFAVAWDLIPVPSPAGYFLVTAFLGLYLFTLSRFKFPKTPFSDNIAHSSHPSNVMIGDMFKSLAIATPFLLGIAWLAERTGY